MATSGVGCMASVYIHIGNANIHIGNVNIRIGSHVRTHWSTRTYALSNTDVRIGLYIYMYRVRLRHILHQDLIRLPPPVFAGVQNFGWKPKVQKRGCVKTEMVYLFVKMIALSTFWHPLNMIRCLVWRSDYYIRFSTMSQSMISHSLFMWSARRFW